MFYGPGGVAEMQAEEYKVRPRGSASVQQPAPCSRPTARPAPLPPARTQDGYVVLTNYRLIWIGSRASASAAAREADAAAPPCHLPLPAVSAAEHKSGIVRASRLKLSVRLDSTSFPTPGACTCKGRRCTAALHAAWEAATPGRGHLGSSTILAHCPRPALPCRPAQRGMHRTAEDDLPRPQP